MIKETFGLLLFDIILAFVMVIVTLLTPLWRYLNREREGVKDSGETYQKGKVACR